MSYLDYPTIKFDAPLHDPSTKTQILWWLDDARHLLTTDMANAFDDEEREMYDRAIWAVKKAIEIVQEKPE